MVEDGADRAKAEVIFNLFVARCNIVGVDIALDELIDLFLFFSEIHSLLLKSKILSRAESPVKYRRSCQGPKVYRKIY
jgi:hypothetical protein